MSVSNWARDCAPADQSPPFVEQQNTNPAPRDRQRVRRACEFCRKKKIKCNGEEPCHKCLSCGITCEYLDSSQVARPPPPAGSSILESRVASIEQLVEERVGSMERLLQRILNQGNGTAVPLEDDQSREPVSPSDDGNEHNSLDPDHDIPTEKPQSTTDIVRTAKSVSQSHQNQIEARADDLLPTPQMGKPDAEFHNCEADLHHFCYADGFGELIPDVNGILRYVGLGSMASVIDRCIGLRRHINNGLREKGFGNWETFSGSQSTPAYDGASPVEQSPPSHPFPPRKLVYALFEVYAENLFPVFPIITRAELCAIYDELLDGNNIDPGRTAILFSALAAAVPLVGHELDEFERADMRYSEENLGPHFYGLAYHQSNFMSTAPTDLGKQPQDNVIAFGLQSMFLTETGSQAEAWVMNGRAIRLGQDIGLHRSPEALRLPAQERNKRRLIWWCLYVLDRQLGTALGRPLAIDDTDCDVELPEAITSKPEYHNYEVFISLIHLHKILGTILRTINSVKYASDWLNPTKHEKVRNRVKNINQALQKWAENQVPPQIKGATHGKLLVGRHICLTSYYSAIILLYRGFMPHPHRSSALGSSQVQARCAKVASDCIRGSVDFLRSVPRGHYRILHGQNIFVCAILSLQCIRGSDDKVSNDNHFFHIQLALESLRALEHTWKGAKKCQGVVEEYLEMTMLMQQGYYSTQTCNFSHLESHSHGSKIAAVPQISISRKRTERPTITRHPLKTSHQAYKRLKHASASMPSRQMSMNPTSSCVASHENFESNYPGPSDVDPGFGGSLHPQLPNNDLARTGFQLASSHTTETWPIVGDIESSLNDLFAAFPQVMSQDQSLKNDLENSAGAFDPSQGLSDAQLWAIDL